MLVVAQVARLMWLYYVRLLGEKKFQGFVFFVIVAYSPLTSDLEQH